jgi:uncharacterized SAM-binding protein YcdF (DUF218 family)
MLPRADAAVVLGCTVERDGRPSMALGRRVRLAARMFQGGLCTRIIASGGRRWGEHVEALVMRRELRRHGVPDDRIVMELLSLTTLENGYYTAELVRALGARSVLVATCRWHLPRALGHLRRFGVEALAPPAGWLEGGAPSSSTRWRERASGWLDALVLAQQAS